MSHLWSRDEEEASRQEQTLKSSLEITELNAFEVENRLTVSQHQSIESKDLEHLECCNQSASALLYHMADWV